MDKKYHFIYKTTCVLTNNFYIGMHSTNDINDGYLGSGVLLLKSIKKYGRDSHVMEVLEYCYSRHELECRERQMVNEDLLSDEKCLNLRLGGEGGYGIKHSDETKLKMSISRRGKKLTEDHKKKVAEGNKGKIVSAETRKKQSDNKKKMSDEYRAKLSDAKIGNSNRPTKQISMDGVMYTSIADASRITGIKLGTIWHRLRSSSDKFKNTFYVDVTLQNDAVIVEAVV